MCGNPFKMVGGLAGKLLGLNAKKALTAKLPVAPVLQDAKTPNVATTINQLQQEQTGLSGGIANTLLTGAGGIDDEQLRLSRKTLLGG